MLHLTCDIWHLTPDTGLLTHEMWHVVGCEHSLKIAAVYWSFEGLEDKDDFFNESMICDKGVCRTAQASQGLLIAIQPSLNCWNSCQLNIANLYPNSSIYTSIPP